MSLNLRQAQIFIDEWLGKQHQAMCTQLHKWSSLNSGSWNLQGLHQQSLLIEKTFQTIGKTQRHAAKPYQQVNDNGFVTDIQVGEVLCCGHQARPDAPSILLTGHMDTVFPESSSFQQITKFSTDRWNGPGLADMKGGLVIMYYALSAFMQTEFANQLSWQVLINSDEEIGSLGSAPWLTHYAQDKLCAFVYEPALDEKGTFAGARKGSGKFTIVVKGASSHAGRAFYEGKHAIAGVSDYVLKVHELNGQREDLTINVGLIHGGKVVNAVPDLAIARLDLRFRNHDDMAWCKQQFATISEQIESKYGVQVECHGDFGRMPKPLEGKTLALFEWVRSVGEDMGLSLGWQPSGGCCDGNNLAAAGLSVIDTLGVRGGKIHSEEEFVCLDSLVERARLSAHLLLRLACQGKIGND
jgi:glutamate carboxypeptidase